MPSRLRTGGSFCGREDEARARGSRRRFGARRPGRPTSPRHAVGDQPPHLGYGYRRPRYPARQMGARRYRGRGEVAGIRRPRLRRRSGPARFSRGGIPGSPRSPDLALPCGVARTRREPRARRHPGLRSWRDLYRRLDFSGTGTRERRRDRMARGGLRAMEGAGAGGVAGCSARGPPLAPLRRSWWLPTPSSNGSLSRSSASTSPKSSRTSLSSRSSPESRQECSGRG